MRAHGQLSLAGVGARLIAAVGMVVLLALLIAPSLASAAALPSKGVFSSAAQPTLATPTGMAVDPVSGDLYVINLEDQTLHRYKPDGTPDNFSALTATNVIDGHAGEADAVPGAEEILAGEEGTNIYLQVAVAPAGAAGGTAGDIYVTNAANGQIDVFSPTGAFIASKAISSFPCGVAVDPTGNVFVGDYEGEKAGVNKFTPTAPGVFTESAKNPYTAEHVCQLAAGTGFVYATQENGPVSKIHSEGAEEGVTQYVVGTGNNGTVAVNSETGHLFTTKIFDTGQPVDEYDVSGAVSASLVSETSIASEPRGIAVNGEAGNLYVTRSGEGKVAVFGSELVGELKIVKSGTGASTITSVPPGINCGLQCEATFALNAEVELTVAPSAGSEFTGWSTLAGSPGTCTGTTSPCKVALPGLVELKASSAKEPTLTITEVGSGSGSVSCTFDGGAPQACGGPHPKGSKVQLTATPAAGSALGPVSGAGAAKGCGGSGCNFTLNESGTVKVEFTKVPQRTLSITNAGTGSGTVTCNGGACASTYLQGTTITLAASPASGSGFAGFSGGGCSGTSCTITLNADTTVTATFNANVNPSPPSCVVPKLAKKSLSQAKSALKKAHCTLGKVTKPKPKKGKKQGALVVKSSQPAAGKVLAENAKVGLKLGPKPKKKGGK